MNGFENIKQHFSAVFGCVYDGDSFGGHAFHRLLCEARMTGCLRCKEFSRQGYRNCPDHVEEPLKSLLELDDKPKPPRWLGFVAVITIVGYFVFIAVFTGCEAAGPRVVPPVDEIRPLWRDSENNVICYKSSGNFGMSCVKLDKDAK